MSRLAMTPLAETNCVPYRVGPAKRFLDDVMDVSCAPGELVANAAVSTGADENLKSNRFGERHACVAEMSMRPKN